MAERLTSSATEVELAAGKPLWRAGLLDHPLHLRTGVPLLVVLTLLPVFYANNYKKAQQEAERV